MPSSNTSKYDCFISSRRLPERPSVCFFPIIPPFIFSIFSLKSADTMLSIASASRLSSAAMLTLLYDGLTFFLTVPLSEELPASAAKLKDGISVNIIAITVSTAIFFLIILVLMSCPPSYLAVLADAACEYLHQSLLPLSVV